MNKKIYADNASTTYPKPASVAEAVYNYMTGSGCNINRGCYEGAYETEEAVYETRELLTELFHGPDPSHVIFTRNITESLNTVLKGFLKSGDHVLVSSMEHNAVMRPLTQLSQNGISFDRIPCNSRGELLLSEAVPLLKPQTRAMILMHASNVCGTVMPLAEAGAFCQSHGLKLIADTAQTAGLLPIDMEKDHIDVLCFTGHKGLLGPQGIGGFLITPEMALLTEPLVSGGTGSISHTEEIPDFMPDRFEAGTPNLPGILGLRAALLWLREETPEKLLKHELRLTEHFLKGVAELEPAVKIVGKKELEGRTGVVSLSFPGRDASMIAALLDSDYQIQTRVGLHCAPSAHKTLGTYPEGTVRFSFGWNNTVSDVDCILSALRQILGSDTNF